MTWLSLCVGVGFLDRQVHFKPKHALQHSSELGTERLKLNKWKAVSSRWDVAVVTSNA